MLGTPQYPNRATDAAAGFLKFGKLGRGATADSETVASGKVSRNLIVLLLRNQATGDTKQNGKKQ